MKNISWREQLTLCPELRDCAKWTKPNVSMLSDSDQTAFYHRLNAINCFLSGTSAAEVATKYRCSIQELYRLLHRALASAAGEAPQLANGLVPHRRIKDYERTVALGTESKGLSGAFNVLRNRYPKAFEELQIHFKKELAGDATTPHLTSSGLVSKFRELLVAEGCTATEYPFTTTGHCRESLRQLRQQTRLDIAAQLSGGRRHRRFAPEVAPLNHVMDEFQLDGHLQDFETSLLVEHSGRQQLVRMARFWLLVLAESESTAIFGYSFGYSRQYAGRDVLNCLDRACGIWEPYTDLPCGLRYPVDGGLPSAFAELRYAIPSVVKLDNSWAHYHGDVVRALHNGWSVIINWGRPRVPIARRVVEMIFRRLSEYEHESPGTTGNNPFDGRRDRRRDRPPAISVLDIPKIVDVCICEHNAAARADLLNKSPLDVVRTAASSGTFVRRLDERCRASGSLFRARRTFPLRGNPQKHQRYHINFAYEPYFGSVLAELAAKRIASVAVDLDIRDIRSLDVLEEGGNVLGQINVQGVWARFPHDEAFRRFVWRKGKDEKFRRMHPLIGLWESLTANIDKPSAALRLFDLAQRSIGDDLGVSGAHIEKRALDVPSPVRGRVWKPRIATPGQP